MIWNVVYVNLLNKHGSSTRVYCLSYHLTNSKHWLLFYCFIDLCFFLVLGPIFYATRSGRPFILMDGYRYMLKNEGRPQFTSKKVFRCNRWSHGCRASITAVDTEIVKCRNFHSNHWLFIFVIFHTIVPYIT